MQLDEFEEGVVLLRLSLDYSEENIELAVQDNTIEGTKQHDVLSNIATGIVILLDQDPTLLFNIGLEGDLDSELFVDDDSSTKH